MILPPGELLREIVCSLGTPEGNLTDYHDWTGQSSGASTCGVCGRAVLIAYHESRPDGKLPVILETLRDREDIPDRLKDRSPWRALKRDGSDDVLCQFIGFNQKIAQHFNHRLVCPKTRPKEAT